jgi:hypothetical protein
MAAGESSKIDVGVRKPCFRIKKQRFLTPELLEKMMSNPELKIVKQKRRRKAAKPVGPVVPELSPEELAEAERFKALTAARAARRAVVQRLIARLQAEEPDSLAEAA